MLSVAVLSRMMWDSKLTSRSGKISFIFNKHKPLEPSTDSHGFLNTLDRSVLNVSQLHKRIPKFVKCDPRHLLITFPQLSSNPQKQLHWLIFTPFFASNLFLYSNFKNLKWHPPGFVKPASMTQFPLRKWKYKEVCNKCKWYRHANANWRAVRQTTVNDEVQISPQVLKVTFFLFLLHSALKGVIRLLKNMTARQFSF